MAFQSRKFPLVSFSWGGDPRKELLEVEDGAKPTEARPSAPSRTTSPPTTTDKAPAPSRLLDPRLHSPRSSVAPLPSGLSPDPLSLHLHDALVADHFTPPRPPPSPHLVDTSTRSTVALSIGWCRALELLSSASRDRRCLLPLRSPASSSIPTKPATPKPPTGLCVPLCFFPLFSPVDPETADDAIVINYVDDDPSPLSAELPGNEQLPTHLKLLIAPSYLALNDFLEIQLER
nr:uncharacterized protein LOC109781241 [Aegilops tauschii subsp. strangulata]